LGLGFNNALVQKVKEIGPAGFRLVRNASVTDKVLDYIEGMPQAWVDLYIAQGYAMSDPVLIWSMLNSGAMRWSDIPVQDFNGVLEKAKVFGLNFGVVVSQIQDGRFSILSVARSDREYSQSEIDQVKRLLAEALSEQDDALTLKPKELEVLWALSQGASLEEIATEKGIAISTVKKRLNKARVELGAHSTIQAVAQAVRLNLFVDQKY